MNSDLISSEFGKSKPMEFIYLCRVRNETYREQRLESKKAKCCYKFVVTNEHLSVPTTDVQSNGIPKLKQQEDAAFSQHCTNPCYPPYVIVVDA